MISYADFEFAIKRWKAREAGVSEPASRAVSGMVDGRAGARAEHGKQGVHGNSGLVTAEQRGTNSGSILVDEALLDGSGPLSQ